MTHRFTAPFVFTVLLPSRAVLATNAILSPSGDHTGMEANAFAAVNLVSAVAPEPSAFTTQILAALFVFAASLPSKARGDSKVILLPSADHTRRERIVKTPVVIILVTAASADTTPILTQKFVVAVWLPATPPPNTPP